MMESFPTPPPEPATPQLLAEAVLAKARRDAEKRQARHAADLADTIAEVEHVYDHWATKLGDRPEHTSCFAGEPITSLVSALLTIATLDNMPEELP